MLGFTGRFVLDELGAAWATRLDRLRCLKRSGVDVRLVVGMLTAEAGPVDPREALRRLGLSFEVDDGGPLSLGMAGVRIERPPRLSLVIDGIPVETPFPPPAEAPDLDPETDDRFERLALAAIRRERPSLVVGLGVDRASRTILAGARELGIATVIWLDGLAALDHGLLSLADAIIAPTRAAADFVGEAYGVRAVSLPDTIAEGPVRAESRDPKFLTFVDPTAANGAYAFSRIADELGRQRPDIPILVVEGRGTEESLAACGLDLTVRGNVSLMSRTRDPRKYWRVARLCLVPTLGWDVVSRAAVEAMINGVPVIGSDRGDLPSTIGEAGVTLPLPDRLTPATRMLPTPGEVSSWVREVVGLWDDAGRRDRYGSRGEIEARRWSADSVGPAYARFFTTVRPAACTSTSPTPGRSRSIVLVPYIGTIEPPCEAGLQRLEAAGVRVSRRGGSSAIDVARNEMASEALHEGFESLLFIDSDIGFEPIDALRLLARPEPIVAGVYAKKAGQSLTSAFDDGIDAALFGPDAEALYPLRFAATGFLRIKAAVLRRMIDVMGLPLCNTRWGRGVWPFFHPMIVPDGEGHHYLAEDWAFSRRLLEIGVTPMADTSIRLWHVGRYQFGWEDAGEAPRRFDSYLYRLK